MNFFLAGLQDEGKQGYNIIWISCLLTYFYHKI